MQFFFHQFRIASLSPLFTDYIRNQMLFLQILKQNLIFEKLLFWLKYTHFLKVIGHAILDHVQNYLSTEGNLKTY